MSEEGPGGDLEERVRRLEEEVKKSTDAIKDVLMDVRTLVSELENPFNYLAAYLKGAPPGTSHDEDEGAEGEESGGGQEDEPAPSEAQATAGAPAKAPRASQLVESVSVVGGGADRGGEWDRVKKGLTALVVAEYLYRMFGPDLSRKLLLMYSKRGWISQGSTQLLLTILDDLPSLSSKYPQDFNYTSPEDHVIALCLIKAMEDDSINPQLLLMLMAMLKKIPGYDSPLYPFLKQLERRGSGRDV